VELHQALEHLHQSVQHFAPQLPLVARSFSPVDIVGDFRTTSLTPPPITHGTFIFGVLVEFEGRLVVAVNVSGGSRVISIVVRTEGYAGLQIGKKFLGKTVDACSVFEFLGMRDVLINVAIWRAGVVLHILNLVQAVEDVITKIVEERIVVILLLKNHAIVFQPIGIGPVSVIKHAAR
jgi:hypothetical protein